MMCNSILFVFFATAIAMAPPKITSDEHQIQEHEQIGKFLEVAAHTNVKLVCSGRFESLEFTYPKLDDHLGYDEEEVNGRRSISVDDAYGDVILEIKDVKETDTGSYGCRATDHTSLNESVYIFVQEENSFVPLKALGFAYPHGHVIIPCKATSFFDKSDIKLRGNGKAIKDAQKHYDHRYGFKLTKKMYESRPIAQVPFECSHPGLPHSKKSGEAVTYLITEKEEEPESGEDEDYQLYWTESSEWPHQGMNYTLTCHLTYSGKGPFLAYVNKLQTSCPRCSNDPNSPAYSEMNRMIDKGIHAKIRIPEMSAEDTGDFTCSWSREGRTQNKVITKKIEVSPTVNQIKIVTRSPSTVNVAEGEPLSLNAKIAIYPKNKELYRTKWIRNVVLPMERDEKVQLLVSDADKTISSDSEDNVFDESLVFNGNAAKVSSNGRYLLRISHGDVQETIAWDVNVTSEKVLPRALIHTEPKFELFGQKFFMLGALVEVDCIVAANPRAELKIGRRMKPHENGEFANIPRLFDRNDVNGTYEVATRWRVNVREEMEVQCQGIRDGKSKNARVTIYVAQNEPTATRRVGKHRNAMSNEDAREIVEGDNVAINCMIPDSVDWNVTWWKGDKQLVAVPFKDSVSRHVTSSIRNITVANGGEYICQLQKGDEIKKLSVMVNVEKSSAPTLIKPLPSQPLSLVYDEFAEIPCNIEGSPTPEFVWYKDNQMYRHGDTNLKNGSLIIPRVGAEDEGNFRCEARNRAGWAEYKLKVKVPDAPQGLTTGIVATLVTAFVVLGICLGAVLFYARWQNKRLKLKEAAMLQLYEQMIKSQPGPLTEANLKLPIDQRVYQLPYKNEFELDRKNLELEGLLGQGNFGRVHRGLLKKPNSDAAEDRLEVAVKSPLNKYDVAQYRMLAEELKIMCAIGKHPNVLALVGAVTDCMKRGELFVVFELCENDSLRNYLLKHKASFLNELNKVQDDDDGYMRPKSAHKSQYASETDPNWESQRLLEENASMLSTSDLIAFSYQIASGMEYLSSIPCLHRDLAARNVLLTSTRICRIADFGMARKQEGDYYKTVMNKNESVPYRWMSIEAIRDQKFTVQSDVWSFGILLYEIFDLGGVPYPSCSNFDLFPRLVAGYRNARPPYAHENIYSLMLQCWTFTPEQRPSFLQCMIFLKEQLRIASPKYYYNLENQLHEEMRKQNQLSSWLEPSHPPQNEPEDPRILASFSPQPSTSTAERIYIPEFPNKKDAGKISQ
ncbi:unnamed protein product [Caenorhabditis auriculariae]|uniref:receptor protein-tyrosine kinase n=1 Tax=Caenorhabditis auriculariae TaxID=2777116 RepID=A0A8S1HD04_9PELO|nr:unnamed protein product [Caenorhabditis auriculariae]